uniref:Alpha-N-acetylglucosaminidase n=1 Tax=Chenopodium quinoa TaxID=63459 RepID=A0A803MI61_CHEQI
MNKIKLLLPILALLLIFLTCDSSQHNPEEIRSVINRLDSQRSSPTIQENAAKALLHRLLPSHSSSFIFNIISKDVCGGDSCFRVENYNKSSRHEPQIVIRGTTAVEIASGLHWYLKYLCGAHISWEKTGGVHMASIPDPGSLPFVKDGGLVMKRPIPWNYYQNVVISNSFVWWDWQRWEKEIDWMALQGINLPLAFTGQEAIWQKVFVDFNVSKDDLNDFFGGPAFLAWARMGNLHGLDITCYIYIWWTIVANLVGSSIGLAEADIIPDVGTRNDPRNTVSGDPRWCCTFLLDPSDPLFVKLGKAFIKNQFKVIAFELQLNDELISFILSPFTEYGDVTNMYNCDTFNENSPPTDDPTYISSLRAAVYEAMVKGDKYAVWLMQALLHSVPKGKMVVLDLFAEVKPVWETSSQFYGTPYVWCMLHNFGENIEMYGVLDSISSGPVDARTSENSTMVLACAWKVLSTVVYELMSEMAYRNEKIQLVVNPGVETSYHRTGSKLILVGAMDHNKDYIVEFPD